MTSNQHGPYVRGDTRVTMAWNRGKPPGDREQADLMVDTYLPYETNILMQHIGRALHGEEEALERADLAPLGSILDAVVPIDYKPYMPEDSVLHEFIG